MLHYVARRILLMIPTLFVISALVYVIIDLPPGDCVTSQIDELLSRGDPDALTVPIGLPLREVEKQFVLRTLAAENNNKTRAA